jgi:hypothetical protein
MIYVAWDLICISKEVEGLDLRRLDTLNDAMILKFFWVMVLKTNNIWSQICRVKYEKGCTLWTVEPSQANSTTFNKIIQAREKILYLFIIQMESGERVQAVGEL